MSLPSSWTLVTITGTFTKRNGAAAQGYVTFESMQPVVIGGVIIVPDPIRANLDGNGQISVQLPATNDPDLSVTGWTYTVTEHMDNGRSPYQIEVPYTVSTLDLATVPVATPNPSVPSSTALHLSDVGVVVQAYDQTLAALAAQDWVANSMPVGTGTDAVTQLAITANTFPARSSGGSVAAKSITDFGLSLVDDADAAAARTTLAATGSAELAASGGSALVGFLQSGTGATARTVQSRLRDRVAAKDFGAAGDGSTDDGPEIAAAIAAHGVVEFPAGTYANTSTAIAVPINKTLTFRPGADISSSGSGSTTYSGFTLREGYNPSGFTAWTTPVANAYEGFAADLGGYGPKQFGSFGLPTGLSGAVKVPSSTSASIPHANGVAGYASSASTNTGAVPLFGHGKVLATNALAWGLNTVTEDNGFATTVWGYECDLNVSNASTNVFGVQVTGGSTVEPTTAIGFQVAPINPFTSPKKRWSTAFESQDGSAVAGLSLGAQGDVASSASQTLRMYYKNAGNTKTLGFDAQVDSAGNMLIVGGASGAFFGLRGGGGGTSAVTLQGNNLGFFGATPVAQQTSAPNATDLATCITLANALKTGLVNLGLST